MARRFLLPGLMVLLFCFGLVSCNVPMGKEQEGQGLTHSREGNRTPYRFQRDNYNYLHDDGRNGITNTNPNMRTGEWSRFSRKEDIHRIRTAVLEMDGVKDAKVQITGGHATVRVIPEPGFPKKKYEALQEKVLRKVTFLMPRYEIRVRVGPSVWNPLRFLS